MNIIRIIKKAFGNYYKVIKADYSNAYPGEVGTYLIYNPWKGYIYEHGLTKKRADELAHHFNEHL